MTRKTETENVTSDSTAVTTVDQDTDSRHHPAAVLETPVKVDDSDTNHANLPERKQEFAVPVLPTLPKRKNKTLSKTLVEETSREKETESSEKTETSEQLENECQAGRKRVGLDVSLQQEENEKTEENVSCSNILLIGFCINSYRINFVERLTQSLQILIGFIRRQQLAMP